MHERKFDESIFYNAYHCGEHGKSILKIKQRRHDMDHTCAIYFLCSFVLVQFISQQDIVYFCFEDVQENIKSINTNFKQFYFCNGKITTVINMMK